MTDRRKDNRGEEGMKTGKRGKKIGLTQRMSPGSLLKKTVGESLQKAKPERSPAPSFNN